MLRLALREGLGMGSDAKKSCHVMQVLIPYRALYAGFTLHCGSATPHPGLFFVVCAWAKGNCSLLLLLCKHSHARKHS